MAEKKVWLIWSGPDQENAEKISAFFRCRGYRPDESEEPPMTAVPEGPAPENPDEPEENRAAGILLRKDTAQKEKEEAAEQAREPEEELPPTAVRLRFLAPDTVAEDTAVVVLSDEATRDPSWQEAVRSIPAGFRIIPVGGTVQANYNDPKVLPRRVQEINYINPDDDQFTDSLEDALLTAPDFYPMKNEVFFMCHMWSTSTDPETGEHDNSLLMSGIRKTKQYLRRFREVYSREKNPAVLKQGQKACAFLEESHNRAILNALRDAWRYFRSILLIGAGVGLLFSFLYVSNVLSRSYYSQILLGIDNSEEDAALTAVKIAEGITNPFVPQTTKGRYYGYLSELLEKNWPNSPLAMGQYKWALNDAVPDADQRYFWTANGKGQVVRWDSWTGEIVRRETVASVPLAAMDLAASGLRAVADSEGKIYLSSGEHAWRNTGVTWPVSWTDADRLRLSADGTRLLALDGERMYSWAVSDGGLTPLWHTETEVSDAEFTPEGDVLCVIRRDGAWLAARIDGSGRETVWPLGKELSETCGADVTESRALFADTEGHVWIWDSAAPEDLINTELLLDQPVALALSGGDYLVYHERSEGSRVYDFRQHIVLADCLPYSPGIRRLELEGNLVYGWSAGLVHSEDLSAVLPLKAVPGEILRTLDAASDTNSGKAVKSISITNEYLVTLEMIRPAETTVVFDPASRYFIGTAQLDLSIEEGLPGTFSTYSGVSIHMTGRPTVVGLIPEHETFVVGGYDGSFYEVCVDEENGSAFVASHTQVPSHAAIRAVHQTADAWYLEDAAGNIWYKRLGYPAITSTGHVWMNEIRDKLHLSVSDDLLKVISPQTAKELNLHKFSIPDGKEWE